MSYSSLQEVDWNLRKFSGQIFRPVTGTGLVGNRRRLIYVDLR